MRKMRFATAIILTMVLALIAAACGDDEAAPDTGAAEAAAAQAEAAAAQAEAEAAAAQAEAAATAAAEAEAALEAAMAEMAEAETGVDPEVVAELQAQLEAAQAEADAAKAEAEAAAAAAEAAAAAAEAAAEEPEPVAEEPMGPEGDMIFAIVNYPQNFDSPTSYDNTSIAVWGAWWEYLVRPTPDQTGFVPRLAESWDVSDDGMTYTFNLRDGVTFHNGAAMTSEDVTFSLDRAITTPGSQIGFLAAKVESITPTDDLTVVVQMNEPWPYLLHDVSGHSAPIWPKDHFNEVGLEAFLQAPVGTGPFVWDSADPGSSITAVANPDYWEEGKPLMASVTFQVFADDTARATAVQGGQADVAEAPPRNQLREFEGRDDLKVYWFPSTRVDVIAINVREAPFDDATFRKAISLGIDRQAIVNAGLFGFGQAATTFIVPPPGQTFANPNLNLYPYDPGQARRLLAESGVSLPMTVQLEISEGTVQEAIGGVVQSNLADLDINVELIRKDAASVDNDIIGGTYQMATTFWGNLIPDPTIEPQFWVDPAYCCDAYFTGFNDPDATALLHEAINAFDAAEAQPLFDELQRVVADAAHVLPLFVADLTYMSTDEVTGFFANAYGTYPFEQIGLSG